MDKGKAETLDSRGGRGARLLGISDSYSSARPGSGRSASTSALDRWVLERVLRAAGSPRITVQLWDGREVGASKARATGRIVIRDRRALYGLLYRTDLHFGDAFAAGGIEVEGDLVGVMEAINAGLRQAMPHGSWKRRVSAWVNRPQANSRRTARDNIHHHYDLGNDFYRLWLDEQLVYTCAYFPRPEATLQEAQAAKLEHVCRKLELEPGLRVVEAGCGWGALALHMARCHGVSVRAYNISREQIRYARERAQAEGLDHLVEFVEDDYRAIDDTYDRFVSVGMLEHVGVHNYPELGRLIARCLGPEGRGLIHTIGRNAPAPNNPWIEQRIFPGSRPPSLAEMSAIFEPQDLCVLDVENLRLHYARTCREWLERFERVAGQVREMYDERFVRAWRLYLSGSVAAFTTGSLQLFQVLFAPRASNAVPLTREHLYREPLA